MLEILSVLMCGGGGAAPAPYVPPPAPVKRSTRSPASEIKRRQSESKGGPGGIGGGSTGTLFAGTQGVGDLTLSTGKTLLGG